MSNQRPLADKLRPTTLDEVVGQKHLLGKSGLLRRVIESGRIPNMIFYGPSGTGKTTLAGIIAEKTERTLYKLNATSASLSDVKAIIDNLDTMLTPNGVLLYLDEIQYFNTKQQQSLLEFIENGKVTLIASTTENPYFYVYNAILSRSTVFEFIPVTPVDIIPAVRRAINVINEENDIEITCEDGVERHIAHACGGDVRKAIGAVEMLFYAVPIDERKPRFTIKDAQDISQSSAMRYDKDGDSHYDILSAFQKSIRGSDPNAAIHYLARLLIAGDLPSACRRLLVTASEDIGLAYPQVMSIVKDCVDSALQLGLPEAQMPLSAAVLLCATAPKSNSASCAVGEAMSDLRNGVSGDVPAHIKDAHYEGAKKLGNGLTYQYPHAFPNHYVAQQYLPDKLKDREYYVAGDNKTEQAAKKYWELVIGSVEGAK